MRRNLLALAMGCLVLACNQAPGPIVARQPLNHARDSAGFVLLEDRSCKVWTSSAVEGEIARWSGFCNSVGFAMGPGRLQLFGRDGALLETYDGALVAGVRTGRGVLQTERLLFEGTFEHGKRTGRGEERTNGGDRYVGNFLDDKRAGRGILMQANGDGYYGRWLNDYPDGYGEAVLGHVEFRGKWRKGCLHNSAQTIAIGRPLAECNAIVQSTNEYSKAEMAAIGQLPPGRDLPPGGCQPPKDSIWNYTYLLCR